MRRFTPPFPTLTPLTSLKWLNLDRTDPATGLHLSCGGQRMAGRWPGRAGGPAGPAGRGHIRPRRVGDTELEKL